MIDERPVTIRPGDARSPGPSTRDYLEGDRGGAPAPLLEESYEFLGDADVPFSHYTSVAFLDAEYEHMWSKVWQWACRDEHIPEIGDYYVYDIGDRSVIVVRTVDGIKAYNNFCLHRGTQLKPSGTSGWAKQFRCPFHGWTWDVQGRLVDLPCRWDFPHVTDDEFALPEIRVGQWGGFVFVNFDPAAEPLEQYLGVIPDHFARAGWDLADRYVEVHIRKQLPANWKGAMEAFLEAYHVLETHWQAVKTTGDANTQYDVFEPNVSRFVQTAGTPSPHNTEVLSEQDIVDLMFARKFPGESVTLPDGMTAREFYANYVKAALGERYGHDFSGATISETIDSIEYHLFPNAVFFPGLVLPMVYRFRPNGHDPDSCTFDLLFLRPKPLDGPAPAPAQPVDLGVDDSYTTVPGVDPSLGHVYDQDTSNLAAQTKGFKGSLKRGQTLGNYQEVRARHLHRRLADFLGA